MHSIIATEGLVLQKRLVGEASSSVSLFTRELGLVRATARSARAGKSKLRYGLEPLAHTHFSLVRGLRQWRVVGVERPSFALRALSIASRKVQGRVSALLLRLCDEEPQSELFETVKEGFLWLVRAESYTHLQSIECVLVLRILAHLGYLPRTPELLPFIEADFSLPLAAAAARARARLIRAINDSLSVSGL